MRMIVLKDGDEIVFMAQMNEPSVFDPAALYGSTVRAYRVIAVKSSEPVFELVPLNKPTLINGTDTKRVVEREKV